MLCAHDPVHKPRATANEALTQTKPHRARCRDRSAHRNKVPWRSKSWTRARLSECIGHDDLINCGRPLRRCPSRAVAPYRRHRVGRTHPRCPRHIWHTRLKAGTSHTRRCYARRLDRHMPRCRRCRRRRRLLSAPTIGTRRSIGIILGLPPASALCPCGRR